MGRKRPLDTQLPPWKVTNSFKRIEVHGYASQGLRGVFESVRGLTEKFQKEAWVSEWGPRVQWSPLRRSPLPYSTRAWAEYGSQHGFHYSAGSELHGGLSLGALAGAGLAPAWGIMRMAGGGQPLA